MFKKFKYKNKPEYGKDIDLFNNELLKYWNELPQQFVTSSAKRIGADDILQLVDEVNLAFK